MKWSDNRYTRWERFKNWLVYTILKDDLEDMLADSRAEGVGDGYKEGYTRAINSRTEQLNDLYEQGKIDGIRSIEAKLKAVSLEDVITIRRDTAGNLVAVLVGKEPITDAQITSLKAEASALKEMRLYEIFQSTVAEIARLKMFEYSENFEDMKWGKSMLYVLKRLDEIVNTINSLTVKK